jgi:hypothetical protein
MSTLVLALIVLANPAPAVDRVEHEPIPTSLGFAFAPFPAQDEPPVAVAPPSGSSAETAPPAGGVDEYSANLYRRFSLGLGFAVFSGFDTAIEYGAGGLISANLDLEDELDVDEESSSARIDAQYSFSRAHRLDLSYYDIRRDGTTTLLADSQVGDILFPAGAAVSTELDTTIYKIAYRYCFVTDPKTTISASFGIHWMAIDFQMETASSTLEESFSVDAPLPLIGLHWEYAFTPKWRLAVGTEALRFDLGEIRGVVNDTRLTIEHDTFEHLGWGIGYNAFSLDGHVDDGDENLELEYGYQGLMVYLRTYF